MAKVGAAVVTTAAAIGTALYKTASAAAANADEVDKMSQKIGVSREAYQELDFILSQNGMEVNQLQAGMKTLVNSMQSASEGGADASKAFKTLGINITDSAGALRSQEDVFYDVIAALQGMGNETERNALANQLFGRSASELAPLLNSGAGSMEELRQKAHELGLVLGDDTIDIGVQFTDMVDQVKRSFTAILTQVGADVMPMMMKGLDWVTAHMPEIQKTISDVISNVSEILTELKPIVKEMFEVAEVLWNTVLKPVLMGILDFINGVFTGDWRKAWNGIKNIFTGIWNAIKLQFTQIANLFKSVMNTIKNAIMEKVNAAKQWGRDLIQNFIDGITAKAQALIAKVKNVAQSVKNFLGFSEPKEGPLSNFHTYAPDMMMLFAKGIKDNEHLVTDQIAKSFDFGTDIVGTVKASGTNTSDGNFAAEMRGMREDIRNMRVVLEDGTLVGKISPKIDTALGQRVVANNRYVLGGA